MCARTHILQCFQPAHNVLHLSLNGFPLSSNLSNGKLLVLLRIVHVAEHLRSGHQLLEVLQGGTWGFPGFPGFPGCLTFLLIRPSLSQNSQPELSVGLCCALEGSARNPAVGLQNTYGDFQQPLCLLRLLLELSLQSYGIIPQFLFRRGQSGIQADDFG